jgi:hypothetical protein
MKASTSDPRCLTRACMIFSDVATSPVGSAAEKELLQNRNITENRATSLKIMLHDFQ